MCDEGWKRRDIRFRFRIRGKVTQEKVVMIRTTIYVKIQVRRCSQKFESQSI